MYFNLTSFCFQCIFFLGTWVKKQSGGSELRKEGSKLLEKVGHLVRRKLLVFFKELGLHLTTKSVIQPFETLA